MADECAHCLPLQERSAYWWGQRTQAIPKQIEDAKASADGAITDVQSRISQAYADWQAAFYAWKSAVAEHDAIAAALAGSGGAPLNPGDVSTTARPGWIEVALSTTQTVWARTPEAAEAARAAAGVVDLTERLAAAANRVSTTWPEVQRTLDEIAAAERALQDTIDHWNQRLQQLHEDLQHAAAEEQRWDARYRACIRACKEGQRTTPWLVGVGGMLAGLGVVGIVLGNPLGGTVPGEAAELVAAEPSEAAETTAPSADPTAAITEVASPTPSPDPAVRFGCTGTDHFPEVVPVDARTGEQVDSPSKQTFVFVTEGIPPGSLVDVTVTGPTGTVTISGEVGEDGVVIVDVPLFQYGEHTIDDVTVDPGDGTSLPITVETPGTFTVADPEQDCGPDDVTGVTSEPAPTAEPTTAPTSPAGPDGPRTALTPPPNVDGPSVADAPTTVAAGTPDSGGTETNAPLTGLGFLGTLLGLGTMAGAPTIARRREKTAGTGEDADPPATTTPPAASEDTQTRPAEEPSLLDRLGSFVTEDLPELVDQGTTWLAETAQDVAAHVYGGTTSDGTTTEGLISQGANFLGNLGAGVLSIFAGRTSTPPERTTITLDTGGRGDDSLTKYQTFHIEVTRPRPAGGGDPPATIEVELESSYGDNETLTLAWVGNATGPARYRSKPLTLDGGGEGGGKRTIAGFEFSTGGFDSLWIDDGGTATITVDGETITFRTYNTWVQQGIGRSMEVIERVDAYWTQVDRELAKLPEEARPSELVQWSQAVHEMAASARRSLEREDLLDTTKFANITTLASWITERGFSYAQLNGYGDLWSTIGNQQRSTRERVGQDVLMRGLSGITIGLYRTVMGATPAQSVWTLFTGRDIMNRSVTWDARVFSALELAGWLSLAGGLEARMLADSLPSASRLRLRPDANLSRVDDALGTHQQRAARRAEDAASRVPEPVIRGTAAGRAVEFTEDFGMLRNRARHFQSVADEYGVVIRVRASNFDALDWMTRGHPPKHVKLKSKTINDIDELLGAPTGSRGLVGYFRPKMPLRTAAMDDALWAKIRERYRQRLREYADNAKDMQTLQSKGLVRVEDGVVVDTGLSNTRLVGDELYSLPGNPAGTGRGFTGDHDIFDVTMADGSPVPPDLASRVLTDVMSGVTDVQHGWHTAWGPHLLTDLPGQKYWQNIDIDTVIRNGHRGTVDGGTVRPVGPRAEPLLEFRPGQQHPRTTYDTSPMPEIPATAPSRPDGGRAR